VSAGSLDKDSLIKFRRLTATDFSDIIKLTHTLCDIATKIETSSSKSAICVLS